MATDAPTAKRPASPLENAAKRPREETSKGTAADKPNKPTSNKKDKKMDDVKMEGYVTKDNERWVSHVCIRVSNCPQ
jgi:hypothetical protein